VDVESLIADRVDLRDASRGLDLAARPGTLKVLVDCS